MRFPDAMDGSRLLLTPSAPGEAPEGLDWTGDPASTSSGPRCTFLVSRCRPGPDRTACRSGCRSSAGGVRTAPCWPGRAGWRRGLPDAVLAAAGASTGPLVFAGDPHRNFSPILRACAELPPGTLVLLGDCDLTAPLEQVMAPVLRAGWDVRWILGNHDTETEAAFDHLTSAPGDLGLRVTESRAFASPACLACSGRGFGCPAGGGAAGVSVPSGVPGGAATGEAWRGGLPFGTATPSSPRISIVWARSGSTCWWRTRRRRAIRTVLRRSMRWHSMRRQADRAWPPPRIIHRDLPNGIEVTAYGSQRTVAPGTCRSVAGRPTVDVVDSCTPHQPGIGLRCHDPVVCAPRRPSQTTRDTT